LLIVFSIELGNHDERNTANDDGRKNREWHDNFGLNTISAHGIKNVVACGVLADTSNLDNRNGSTHLHLQS
jgi:hypothetical protein